MPSSSWPCADGAMGQRIREAEWSKTPLGPIGTWPQSLKTAVELMLALKVPAALYVGRDAILIYNDQWATLIGPAHPQALGQPALQVFAPTRALFEPSLQRVWDGETVTVEDQRYSVSRESGIEHAWFCVTHSPLRAADGSVAGIFAVAVQTSHTDRKMEKALRDSETHLGAIVAQVSVGLSRLTPEGQILWVNEELCKMLGRSEQELLSLTVADVTVPEDMLDCARASAEVWASGEAQSVEKGFMRPDGSILIASSRLARLDEADRPASILAATIDISTRVRTERELRQSEERFRQFGNASWDILWIRNADNLQWEYLSEAFDRVYGLKREVALQGDNLHQWIELIVPEDRQHALRSIARVRAGERISYEFRITRPDNAEVRWIRNTDFPILDAAGNVRRIGGIARDITEEKLASDRLQVLVHELQHRTRNLIAVVRSLADKTLRESESLTDFRERFGERLAAISRVQGLLSRFTDGARISFHDLLHAELSAHAAFAEAADRIQLEGRDDVWLQARAVQIFALAIHELTTNAIKYGALATPSGRLSVQWRIANGSQPPRLHVDWRESGVTMPLEHRAPQRTGYGRELIERALPYQLQAETTYEFAADGVHCSLSVPLQTAAVAEQPDA